MPRGFTLIEAVVSVGVVSVLAGLLLVGTVAARRGTTVRLAAHDFGSFLKETSGLVLNGVKGPACVQQCGADQACLLECSRYTVLRDAGSRVYRRETVRGTDADARELPAGALFREGGAITFRATPPTLQVETVGQPLPPGAVVEVALQHLAGQPVWRVCVRGTGGVDVTAGRC